MSPVVRSLVKTADSTTLLRMPPSALLKNPILRLGSDRDNARKLIEANHQRLGLSAEAAQDMGDESVYNCVISLADPCLEQRDVQTPAGAPSAAPPAPLTVRDSHSISANLCPANRRHPGPFSNRDQAANP